MSVFDCHVNRSPLAGRIERIVYRAGAFVSADLDKASESNERNMFVIAATGGTRIGVIQIAGLVARRIVPFVREGEAVAAGQRIGMIRFGSRVDVYLPEGARAFGRRRTNRHRRRNRARRSEGFGAEPHVQHDAEQRGARAWQARSEKAILPSWPCVRRLSADPRLRRRQFRRIPVRTLAPNLVTLLALCAGLTGIRMAFENRYGLALAAIVFAAILDGIDGRLARLLKGTSRFGAELDSLSDFVNFGVAPALILYFWGLHDLKSAGWIAAMAFAICAGLRLARFNVMIADPDRPAWASNFFVGVPAPAGAIIVLLPIYAAFLGLPRSQFLTWATLVYTLLIASLMVSRLPVFSGKRFGTRVPPEMVGPVVIVVVLFVAMLIAYPWIILTVGTLGYLASLPFGWLSYRGYERRARESKAERAGRRGAGAGGRAWFISPTMTRNVRRASIEPHRQGF